MNPFELDRDALLWAGLKALDSVAVSHMVEDGVRNLEDWEKSLRARAASL